MSQIIHNSLCTLTFLALGCGIIGTVHATHNDAFWTFSTSEERPPVNSPNRYLIDQMWCTGSYCDNVRIRNERTWRTYGHSDWTLYFSDSKNGTNSKICSDDRFMTGISCKGRYCDNVAIQCTEVLNTNRGPCLWTNWFSEETQLSPTLPAGYYAVGLQCSGSYCDNKRIFACLAS